MTKSAGPSSKRIRRCTGVAAALLLILHFVLAVGSKLNESTTSDELVHLTAGVSYWRFHDYRLHPENGILPQRWAALPTWLQGASFPPLEGNEYWRANDAWVVGHQFFYETGEDHFPRLMAGRAMIALFSVATGVLVFLWSRRFFGNVGALVSLGFFAFSPDFLAHGALVTSDVCMAFFFLASVGAWWRHLHDSRAHVWWLSAVTLGLAFTAKYSAVLLLPLVIIMALVRALSAEPFVFGGRQFVTRAGKLGAIGLSTVGQAAVAAAIIWAFYGFRYSSANPALPPAELLSHLWELMEKGIGAFGPPIHAARTIHLLPEGYLYGFAYVVKTVATRSAFLNGEYSQIGWPTFFVWTFLLKTTVATLLASVLAGVIIVRNSARDPRWRNGIYRATPLIALFIIYWISSLTSHLNIGHRHLLPIYPVIFIGLGVLGILLPSRPIARAMVTGFLLGWHTLSALSVAPHFIAYFNEIAGGPQNGWRHLVDSSLDWGQDLPGLKHWLDEHAHGEPVFLSYFGTGEPYYYGIRAHRLPFMNNFKFPHAYVKLEPGIYCISATMLQQVYSPVRGVPWTFALEREYQDLRHLEPLLDLYTRDPGQWARVEHEFPREQWQRAINRFDVVRFARLCSYLRARKQDGDVGHSILIYRLSAAEVAGATAGSLQDWSALIERAASTNR